MIYRYRQATNLNQRQQIRWIFLGMLGPLLWFLLANVLPILIPALQNQESLAYIIFQISMRVLSIVLFLAFPACITIAIARYKLFDIDFLINRALVYGALTVILASAFGLVLIVFNAILSALTLRPADHARPGAFGQRCRGAFSAHAQGFAAFCRPDVLSHPY